MLNAIENRFVFYGEWLDSIADLPIEIQDKIIAEIVRYGSNRAFEHSDDKMVAMAVNFTKGAIDNSKNEYLKKVMAGSNYGRKKSIDDQAIYDLAQAGKRSEEIANTLGISKSSVDHSDGWKKRKEKDFVF
jgi:hypothetical protein